MSKKTISATAIIELLKLKHPVPAWATFAELNQGTGAMSGRRIDFYAMHTWPSQNFLRVSYEVKISRADFARELNDPKKREFAESVSNECYFVVPAGLVRHDEVPEGWGLYEVTAGGLRRVVLAQQRRVESMPLAFVAGVARRSSDADSTYPAPFWLCEGKELDLAAVDALVAERAQAKTRALREEARDEFRDEINETKTRLHAYSAMVMKHLGWQMNTPEKLEHWILGKLNEPRPVIGPKLTEVVAQKIHELYQLMTESGALNDE